MTCGGCACTGSSSASREPSATRSPTPACAPPGSCAPAWPRSPTPARPHPRRCEPPTAPTRPPSTTSPAKPASPPEPQAPPQNGDDPRSPDLTQTSRATPPKPSRAFANRGYCRHWLLPPERPARNLVEVAAVGVLLRDLGDFLEQTVLQRDRLEAHLEELPVLDEQIVLGCLVARVLDVVDLRAGDLRDELGQVTEPVRLGHLVKDLHSVTVRRR